MPKARGCGEGLRVLREPPLGQFYRKIVHLGNFYVCMREGLFLDLRRPETILLKSARLGYHTTFAAPKNIGNLSGSSPDRSSSFRKTQYTHWPAIPRSLTATGASFRAHAGGRNFRILSGFEESYFLVAR